MYNDRGLTKLKQECSDDHHIQPIEVLVSMMYKCKMLLYTAHAHIVGQGTSPITVLAQNN